MQDAKHRRTERYFYDVLLHPNRYKLREISWLGMTLSKLLRKPSISILLKGSPNIIHKRKNELTPKKIRKQINLMLKIIPVLSKTLIFNVGKQRWKTVVHEKHINQNLTYQKEIAHFIQCVKSRKKTILYGKSRKNTILYGKRNKTFRI